MTLSAIKTPTPPEWAAILLTILMLVWITWTFNSCSRGDKKEIKQAVTKDVKTYNQHELDSLKKDAYALPADSVEAEYRRELSKH